MDTFNVIAAGMDSDDALKVLGRVADAFDNPSLHSTENELKLFVVNVVKSGHVLTSFPSEESLCQDTTTYESSFDISYDEDVELVESGDVSIWEHATSYPYSRGGSSSKSRSETIFQQDDGTYDVTKMLLTSSPLDRLDRLARMELKKTGWVERVDKWTIVEMGLQGISLPITSPRTPTKKKGSHMCESRQRWSSPSGGIQGPRCPRRETGGESPIWREQGDVTPERKRRQVNGIETRTMMGSPVQSENSGPNLTDICAPSSSNLTTTPIRASRLSRTFWHAQVPRGQTGGRLGQVVRNIVKRMLPPSSVGGATTRPSSAWRRQEPGNAKGPLGDSPSTRTSQAEMTPRSDVSAESGWTFASASSWVEARAQGCLDQTTNRWSGFWH